MKNQSLLLLHRIYSCALCRLCYMLCAFKTVDEKKRSSLLKTFKLYLKQCYGIAWSADNTERLLSSLGLKAP